MPAAKSEGGRGVCCQARRRVWKRSGAAHGGVSGACGRVRDGLQSGQQGGRAAVADDGAGAELLPSERVLPRENVKERRELCGRGTRGALPSAHDGAGEQRCRRSAAGGCSRARRGAAEGRARRAPRLLAAAREAADERLLPAGLGLGESEVAGGERLAVHGDDHLRLPRAGAVAAPVELMARRGACGGRRRRRRRRESGGERSGQPRRSARGEAAGPRGEGGGGRASNLLTSGSGHSTTRRLWKSQSFPRLAAKPALVMFWRARAQRGVRERGPRAEGRWSQVRGRGRPEPAGEIPVGRGVERAGTTWQAENKRGSAPQPPARGQEGRRVAPSRPLSGVVLTRGGTVGRRGRSLKDSLPFLIPSGNQDDRAA